MAEKESYVNIHVGGALAAIVVSMLLGAGAAMVGYTIDKKNQHLEEAYAESMFAKNSIQMLKQNNDKLEQDNKNLRCRVDVLSRERKETPPYVTAVDKCDTAEQGFYGWKNYIR